MGWGMVGPMSHISIVCHVLSQSACADRTVMHPIAKTGFPVFCFHRGPLWNLERTHPFDLETTKPKHFIVYSFCFFVGKRHSAYWTTSISSESIILGMIPSSINNTLDVAFHSADLLADLLGSYRALKAFR